MESVGAGDIVTSVGAGAEVYAGTGVCDGVCTLALESDSDQDVSVGSEVASDITTLRRFCSTRLSVMSEVYNTSSLVITTLRLSTAYQVS